MGRRELLRVHARVEVEFRSFDQFYKEYTKNLSKGGMFIKTENVLKLQTILEISLKLPDLDKNLKLIGEVVHAIDPETAKAHGWEPGLGIQFVDFEEDGHKLLEEYVAKRYRVEPKKRPSDRRAHSRAAVRLRVRFPSLDVLQKDYSRDLSRGGIFIQTTKPREVGDHFTLVLVHPDSNEQLELKGEVVRITREDAQVPGSAAGMGIRFLEMDQEKHRAIEKFLGLGLAVN